MKLIIYKYDRCSTCRKALKFLDDQQIKYTVKNILEEAPPLTVLKKIYGSLGNIKKLLNTSSKKYRELQLKDKVDQMNDEQIFELLLAEPILIKRPLLLIDNTRGLTGFSAEKWEEEFL